CGADLSSGSEQHAAALACPEQRTVELPDERRPVAVPEHLDEGAAGSGDRTCRRVLPARPRVPLSVQRLPRSGGLLEQQRCTKRPRVAEERRECRPQLLSAERLELEERELPAIERFGQRGIPVREHEPDEKLTGQCAAKGVEPRGLPRRLRR